MPGMSGLEALRRLKAEPIAVKVIFLTMHDDAQLAAEALRAGASGFVVKHAAGKELIAAIHTVLRGGKYLTPLSASACSRRWRERDTSGVRAADLPSARGRFADRGGADDEGGRRGSGTVAPHRRDPQVQIMAALGLQTTAELIRYALEHGLTAPPRQG